MTVLDVTFSDHFTLVGTVEKNHTPDLIGAKAHGLTTIPTSWTPPFFVVHTTLQSTWATATPAQKLSISSRLIEIANRKLCSIAQSAIGPHPKFLIRSSAVHETIWNRGQLPTNGFEYKCSPGAIVTFLDSLYGRDDQSIGPIALLVQAEIPTQRVIHLSNERRLSKTRNEWVIAQEITDGPDALPAGCNSTKAPELTTSAPITIHRGKVEHALRRSIRGIGKWANKMSQSRQLLECIYGSPDRLYVVQIDQETENGGVDPRTLTLDWRVGERDSARLLTLFKVGDPTNFRKLSNINDFDVPDYSPPHTLYFCHADSLRRIFEDRGKSKELEIEIESLTGGRLVVREDVSELVTDRDHRYNLPRTDTVTSKGAIEHLKSRLEYWSKSSLELTDICFIFHAFIPAIGSAWCTFDPSHRIVTIHSLWGIPDGLQYLTPDEYNFDTGTNRWTERVHFKERFLQEKDDGRWKLTLVSLSAGRAKSLSLPRARKIAKLTVKIAEKAKGAVHVMFFWGMPNQLGMGDVLPWYRAKETSDYDQKREHRRIQIYIECPNDIQDIDLTKKNSIILSLKPDVEYYRDNDFLSKIAQFAKINNIPIELHGSPLAHAYFLLNKEGCSVFSSFAPSYERVKNKKEFGKLVRDYVVRDITNGGEQASSFFVPKTEFEFALVAKLYEETQEAISATDDDAKLSELADVYEVLRAWVEFSGFDISEVIEHADIKLARKGGFGRGEVLLGTGSKRSQPISKERRPRSFSSISRPNRDTNRLRIPAGSIARAASGENDTLDSAATGERISISMSEEGELIISFSPLDAVSEAQTQLPLFGEPSGE